MFENIIDDKLTNNELISQYEKYLNKFFILKSTSTNSNMLMCKMLNIDGNFLNWEGYDYDNYQKGYDVSNSSLHVREFSKYFKILMAFDTFKEMKQEYKVLLDSNKYNL